MNIKKLSVKIGNQQVNISEPQDQHKCVPLLMQLATVITLDLPDTAEAQDVFNELLSSQSLDAQVVWHNSGFSENQLMQLSKRLDDINLTIRAANCFQNAGFVYVWQVAEQSDTELLKIKNFWRMLFYKVKDLFTELGLKFDMDLSSVKHLLPQPPR